MKTEAWWVCNKCGLPVVRPGKKQVKQTMQDHVDKIHDGLAGFSIRQMPQKKS